MRFIAIALCLLHLAVVTVAGGSQACTCADGSRAIELAGCACPASTLPPAVPAAAPAVDCCDSCAEDAGNPAEVQAGSDPGPALAAPGCRKDLPALHAGVGIPPLVQSQEHHPSPPAGVPSEPCAPSARLRPDPADSPPVPLRC